MNDEENIQKFVLEELDSIRSLNIRGNISPHKYIFLLMMARLYEKEPFRKNCFYLDDLFERNYLETWLEKYPETKKENIFIEYPFYHLSNDKIWNLKIKDSEKEVYNYYLKKSNPRFTKKRLKDFVEFAYLDSNFDKALRENNIRTKIIEWLENKISKISYLSNIEKDEGEEINYKSFNDKSKGNPFVNYLNLLHNRDASSQNLAESLVTNYFSGKIQVSHPLINTIEKIFQSESRRHIILTGHAGDGKTTIAVELFKKIKNIRLEEPLQENLERREDLKFNNKEITIIKDLSEWTVGERIKLVAEMINNNNKQFLLISNSGTLIDAFCMYEETYGNKNKVVIESDILSHLNSCTPEEWEYENNSSIVINLSMICNLDLAERIFRRMIDPKHWDICESSECHELCPIYQNLKLIWNNKKIAIERIFLVYRKMYEYGNRFTLRQLTAHLAYLITSGLNYQDVQKIMENASELSTAEFMFFNRFFGDDGNKIDQAAQQLKTIREIRKEEFGIQVCPVWERRIWMKREDTDYLPNIKGLDNDFARLHINAIKSDTKNSYKAREQIRRIMFFLNNFSEEDQGKYIKTYLNSPMILKLISWHKQTDDELSYEDKQLLKESIFHVLQEYFAGIRLPEGVSPSDNLYITINRGSEGIRQSAQVVLAYFQKKRDFILRLEEEVDGLGGFRRNLVFIFKTVQHKIRFDLPMLDYIIMRNVGKISQRLKSAYVDRLENFKGKLLFEGNNPGNTVNIIRLQVNNKFYQQEFKIKEKRLEVD